LKLDYFVLAWMILLIIFIVGELATVGLTSIWFAAGALVALLAALIGAGPGVQIFLFLAVSAVLLAATRPWARKYINSKTHPTNADSLVGERIRIAERVSNIDQTGMAVVHGQEWTVRAQDDNEIIEEGQLATVCSISGVKLIVVKE
jgi:membrane protein implicated in regulation of membrane protease activity